MPCAALAVGSPSDVPLEAFPPAEGTGRRPWALAGRPLRVSCLLIAALLMSIADLLMTLTHATTIGFAEANPIARALMGSHTSMPVTVWKLGTLSVAFGILFVLRRTRTGELGAWLCVAILAWLMIQWSSYNEHIQKLTAELALGSGGSNVCWVKFDQ